MIKLKQNSAINNYEAIIIIKSEHKEEDIVKSQIIEQYCHVLKSNGATQIYAQNKGRHHLVYPIKRYNDGIFIQINYKANGQIIQKLEKSIRFDESIIRYLIVKQTNKQLSQQS
uniref:30S ribosomal protein S6, chloroplastic n=1 Tax=Rhodochaete parvula TaxID=110510 RepID=A0A1X9PUN9_9RHOD|nr:30S ribosomal protein S6 [Rhodochaete parvula]ASK39701.1 ribosomal protein S6 [Rhodochaete parvula]